MKDKKTKVFVSCAILKTKTGLLLNPFIKHFNKRINFSILTPETGT